MFGRIEIKPNSFDWRILDWRDISHGGMRYFKHRIIRRKFIRKDQPELVPVIAPLQPRLIEGGYASAGLLVDETSVRYCGADGGGGGQGYLWAGCWAHARRKIFESQEEAPVFTGWLLQQIGHLF